MFIVGIVCNCIREHDPILILLHNLLVNFTEMEQRKLEINIINSNEYRKNSLQTFLYKMFIHWGCPLLTGPLIHNCTA